MCKAKWDANRKEEFPEEIQRGGNAYDILRLRARLMSNAISALLL